MIEQMILEFFGKELSVILGVILMFFFNSVMDIATYKNVSIY